MGLLEDGGKDENPAATGLFLPSRGFDISDGFLGGERRKFVLGAGAEPGFDCKHEALREQGAAPRHAARSHPLIFSLDLEGRAKTTFDALS